MDQNNTLFKYEMVIIMVINLQINMKSLSEQSFFYMNFHVKLDVDFKN